MSPWAATTSSTKCPNRTCQTLILVPLPFFSSMTTGRDKNRPTTNYPKRNLAETKSNVASGNRRIYIARSDFDSVSRKMRSRCVLVFPAASPASSSLCHTKNMFLRPHNRRDSISGPDSTNLAFQHDTSHEYKLQCPGVPGPAVHARAHLPLQDAKPSARVNG